jgi:hypothetical protein
MAVLACTVLMDTGTEYAGIDLFGCHCPVGCMAVKTGDCRDVGFY